MTARSVYAVARDEAEDDGLVEALERSGFDVLRLPLLETAPGRDAARIPARLAGLEPETAIAWTSRRAGEALAAFVPTYRERLQHTALFALGSASAASVIREGLTVATPSWSASPTARALADVIAARVGACGTRRVLYLAGNRSLPDFEEALSRHGVAVERMEVYETRFRRADVGPLLRALAKGRLARLVVSSPSAAEALEALLSPDDVEALRRVPVTARGTTTAAALRTRGYRSVEGER